MDVAENGELVAGGAVDLFQAMDLKDGSFDSRGR